MMHRQDDKVKREIDEPDTDSTQPDKAVVFTGGYLC